MVSFVPVGFRRAGDAETSLTEERFGFFWELDSDLLESK